MIPYIFSRLSQIFFLYSSHVIIPSVWFITGSLERRIRRIGVLRRREQRCHDLFYSQDSGGEGLQHGLAVLDIPGIAVGYVCSALHIQENFEKVLSSYTIIRIIISHTPYHPIPHSFSSYLILRIIISHTPYHHIPYSVSSYLILRIILYHIPYHYVLHSVSSYPILCIPLITCQV